METINKISSIKILQSTCSIKFIFRKKNGLINSSNILCLGLFKIFKYYVRREKTRFIFNRSVVVEVICRNSQSIMCFFLKKRIFLIIFFGSTYYSYKYHMELNILYNDNIKSFRVHLHSNLITCFI